MVPFKDMHARSMQNSYHLVMRRVGLDFSLSPIKYVPNTSNVHPIILQLLTIIPVYTVQLFPRTAPSGPHRRPHREYPLRILLPRRHGLGSRTFVA